MCLSGSSLLRGLLTRPTQPDYETAANRACDNQKNACADLANSGAASSEVGDCDLQSGECPARKDDGEGQREACGRVLGDGLRATSGYH